MKIASILKLATSMFAFLLVNSNSAQAASFVNGNIGEYGKTVAYEYFSIKETGTTTIDVDAFEMDFGNGKSKLNPYVYLFKSDEWWDKSDFIAKSSMFDRKIAENKSPTLFDPYISQFLEEGDYFLAISGGDFTLQESLTEENEDTSFGDYQIKFSDNVIAENAVVESGLNKPAPITKSLLNQRKIKTFTNKPDATKSLSNKISVPEPASTLGLLLLTIYSSASVLIKHKNP